MSVLVAHEPAQREAVNQNRRTNAVLCRADDLEAGWGEAVWLPNGQLAVFRTSNDHYYAASHHCPGTGAKVMARGIMGDTLIDGQRVPTIACPLHKEVFRLDTGQGLSGATASLPVYNVQVEEDMLVLSGMAA